MAADTAEQAPDETAPRPEPWPPARHLTVDEAMVAVMREIGGVGKNGFNAKHEYHFRAQEDIVAAVRGPMAKYGLRMLPRVIKAEHFPRGRSNVAILTIEYIVRGPAGDVMEPSIVVVGEGADVSDKASNKAMTAAKKYALVQAFEIASENVEEGDRHSPETESSPLDQYLRQIQRREVWYNRDELGKVRQRAIHNGHANLVMPDGVTLLDTLDAQGNELKRRIEENAQRNQEEREARDAQMRAEHPEYHRSSPDSDVWERPPAAPASSARPATPSPTQGLPAPEEVGKRLAEAINDPQDPVKALNAARKHYTAAVLRQVRITTQWGEMDGNAAITAALKELAQKGKRPQQSAPAAPAAPEHQEHQRAAEPEPASAPAEAPTAPAEHPQPAEGPGAEDDAQEEPEGGSWGDVGEPWLDAPWEGPDGEQETEEPEQSAEEPEAPAEEPEAPAEEPEAPAPEPPKLSMAPARPRGTMSDSQWARYRIEREAELQAYLLGKPLLEYVADLLPAGATSVTEIPGNLRLQKLVVAARPDVVAALIAAGMHRQAEEYLKLGQRAPAPNIEALIDSTTGNQSSL